MSAIMRRVCIVYAKPLFVYEISPDYSVDQIQAFSVFLKKSNAICSFNYYLLVIYWTPSHIIPNKV